MNSSQLPLVAAICRCWGALREPIWELSRKQRNLLSSEKKGTDSGVTSLAHTGMRAGELLEQRWGDVLFDRGELGMLHIRRGGSGNSTKDKDARFVPIHPRIRPIYDGLSRGDELVFPSLRGKGILNALKRAAKKAGVSGGIKTNSLRHHFASMVANSRVPYRMVLAWMGHSSSTILDLYYHLHDEESEAAMHLLESGQ